MGAGATAVGGVVCEDRISGVSIRMKISMTDEASRIRAEYARRERVIPKDSYSLSRAPNLFAQQQKNRLLLKRLAGEGLTPLDGKRILDVGCGDGQQLL